VPDPPHGGNQVVERRDASLHTQARQRRQAFHTRTNDALAGRLRPSL
jgi:hypothetical protein